MSITDELREWAEGDTLRAGMSLRRAHDQALAIADRIDAEADDNERFRRDVEPFCDRLREAAAERADVTMYGVDYVALPVDADAEPIRVGDVMDKGEVTCIRDCGKGWEVVLNNLYTYDTPSLHHHKPTVEDVLREFSCVLMGKREFDGDVTEAVAEFATKLRLADDVEEQE